MAKGNCQYKGTGGQYLPTVLIHLILLGFITLGLYTPWAWVRIFRLKASHTTINGKPVSFTGTGGQLFLLALVQGLITLITFGLYFPWAMCKFFSWRARNTFVDETPSQFVGTGGSLFLPYLIHLVILPVLTLGFYSYYGWFRILAWKEERMRYGGEKTSFGAGFLGFLKVSIITSLISWIPFLFPWVIAMYFRWQVNGLMVGPEPEVEHYPPVKTSVVAVAVLFLLPWAVFGLLLYPYIGQIREFQKMTTQMARTQRGTPGMQRTYKVPKPTSPVAKRPRRKPVSRPAQTPPPSETAPAPSTVEKAAPVAAPVEGDDHELEMSKLNNLIKLGSKDPDAFYNRAWLYAYKGDAQMAEKDYTQALALNTQDGDAYYNRGLVYVKMKNYQQAVADFSEAIKLNPRAVDAYCNRGNAKFQMGRIDLALRDLTAALQINPNDADVYYNRAVVYLAKGLKPKAMADFRKAASLGNNEAKRYLGMAPTRPGKTMAAPRTSHVGWTMNLSNVRTPVTPASGRIHGQTFTVETAKVENNILTLRQGKDFFPDRAVTIFMFLKKGEALEGKTFNIATDHGFGAPHIHMKWRDGGKEAPETKIFMKDYALRLQFKEKENGTLPGSIFLSLPDDSKSFVAGTFLVHL